MVKALRRRHATEEEQRRGLGPTVGEVIEYNLDRRQVVAALQKSAREADSPVTFDDAITADAGRPVREEALKYALGDQTLRKSLADPAAAEPEPAREYESVVLVLTDGRTPLTKCETAALYVEGGRRELQRRLIDAIAKGDHRVGAEDVAALDDGWRIRKGALDAVMAEDEYLGTLGDGDEPLAKSARPSKLEVALEFFQGLDGTRDGADIDVAGLRKSLAKHGYHVDTREAESLARMLAPRRVVTCNPDKSACSVVR
jgi:hypothetical protein